MFTIPPETLSMYMYMSSLSANVNLWESRWSRQGGAEVWNLLSASDVLNSIALAVDL